MARRVLLSELKRFHFMILMKEIKFIIAASQATLIPHFSSSSLYFIHQSQFIRELLSSVELSERARENDIKK